MAVVWEAWWNEIHQGTVRDRHGGAKFVRRMQRREIEVLLCKLQQSAMRLRQSCKH